jgi:SAM-dependent methyltransferase
MPAPIEKSASWKENTEKIAAPDAEEVLRSALNLWWLRPENALALASYVTRGVSLLPGPGERAIEYACGDGVNTFFKCGGRFHPSFDLFQHGIRSEDASTVAERGLDVFDHYEEGYAPAVARRPARGYAAGTDHKEALLRKAGALEFFARLHRVDLREDIPEAEASLDLVYCNSLYWVPEPGKSLALMRKKLKPGGRIVLDVFTAEKKGLDYARLFPEMPPAWQELLNRGRQETNPGLQTEAGWERIFQDGGFRIRERRDILPSGLAWIWNVGLRPFFPALQKLAAHVRGASRIEAKAEWVDTWTRLLLPPLQNPEALGQGARVRLQYALESA